MIPIDGKRVGGMGEALLNLRAETPCTGRIRGSAGPAKRRRPQLAPPLKGSRNRGLVHPKAPRAGCLRPAAGRACRPAVPRQARPPRLAPLGLVRGSVFKERGFVRSYIPLLLPADTSNSMLPIATVTHCCCPRPSTTPECKTRHRARIAILGPKPTKQLHE